jgi:hypothetical protein
MSASPGVILFVAGALTAGFAVAGLFFLRFWVVTRDRLFLAFAIAFWLMGLNQLVAGFSHAAQAENSAAYLLRLVAFGIIIVAVLAKNSRGDSAG